MQEIRSLLWKRETPEVLRSAQEAQRENAYEVCDNVVALIKSCRTHVEEKKWKGTQQPGRKIANYGTSF